MHAMVARAAIIGALALCASLLSARPALAHAPPEVFDVIWRADGRLLIVTNRGLIFGAPDSGSYRLMCNEALHITVTDIPSATYLPDGRVLAATYRGLVASDDDGCSWQPIAPLGATQTTSLAAEPAEAGRIFVASYGPDDGGIWRSDDGAATFTRVLATTDVDFVRSLELSRATDGQLTVYASGSVLNADGTYTHYVTRSRDAGESWDRFEVPITLDELDVSVLAVSPSDPSIVIAKTTSIDPLTIPERLLISRDGGETFASPSDEVAPLHASLSSDGGTLWVAGPSGLFRSTDLATFTRIGTAEAMTYASEHAGRLLAAGRYEGFANAANGIAQLSDEGDGLQSLMELSDVSDGVICEPGTETAVLCETAWRDWQAEVLGPTIDAGVRDAAINSDAAADAAPDANDDAGVSDAARAHGCSTSPLACTSLARGWLLTCICLLIARRRATRSQSR